MNVIINGYSIYKILIVTFLACVLFVPLAKITAKHIGAIDYPNERKVHKKPIPRFGGFAILTDKTFVIGDTMSR